ncbi:MAG: hypothetical protein WCA37_06745 [Terracidiphilus sp.]
MTHPGPVAHTGPEPQRAGSVHDVASALAGTQAQRDCAVSHRTRRVVLASLGVLQDQKASSRRSRALALLAALLFLVVLAPPFCWIGDILIEDERISSFVGQLTIWGFFVIAALLGTALVAGWLRRRS